MKKNKIWYRFRYWAVQHLFTDSEKFIIKISLDINADRCQRVAVSSKVLEYDDHMQDCNDCRRLAGYFSTDDYL